MAAKPKVVWQDFKLMLEQTPAGVAAVAKEMGMSTSKLVSKVQDGTVKTEDFSMPLLKLEQMTLSQNWLQNIKL